MSVNANVLPRSGLIGSDTNVAAAPRQRTVGEAHGWDPEDFAREQIRGLVRRVFFSNMETSVKQVVFSATEPGTNVGDICEQVGHALALETPAQIAIVSRDSASTEMTGAQHYPRYSGDCGLMSFSSRLARNLWRVPELGLRALYPEGATDCSWRWALAELRKNFEYAVIQGAAAGAWSEGGFPGQLADGIILILEANSTRRATARKVKEMLEATQSRLLGTVLSQRRFPVPEKVYRRL